MLRHWEGHLHQELGEPLHLHWERLRVLQVSLSIPG